MQTNCRKPIPYENEERENWLPMYFVSDRSCQIVIC